jgi:hypothetical protein
MGLLLLATRFKDGRGDEEQTFLSARLLPLRFYSSDNEGRSFKLISATELAMK